MFCSLRTSNRPQRENAAGMGFFAVQPPLAYWKKFAQAETLVSMLVTSNPGRFAASIVATDARVALGRAASPDRFPMASKQIDTTVTAVTVKSLRMIKVLQIEKPEKLGGYDMGVLALTGWFAPSIRRCL